MYGDLLDFVTHSELLKRAVVFADVLVDSKVFLIRYKSTVTFVSFI